MYGVVCVVSVVGCGVMCVLCCVEVSCVVCGVWCVLCVPSRRRCAIQNENPISRSIGNKILEKKLFFGLAQKVAAKASFWMIFCSWAAQSPEESVSGSNPPNSATF